MPRAIDRERQAARTRVDPVALRALFSCAAPRVFALSGLPAVIAASISESAAARGITCLHSPLDSAIAPTDVTCYFACSTREALSLLAEHPPLLETAAPFLDDPERTLRVPHVLACRRRTLAVSSRPLIMGILNVTPDSFSDGGEFHAPADAIRRAWRLAEEGADVIDIGGESTRPGSAPVQAETELERVLPVIRGLGADFPLPLSIDTTKSAVAERALDEGADLVNDVSGLRADPAIAAVGAARGVPVVLSHIRGTPKTMQSSPHYHDVMVEVATELIESATRALSAGVRRDAIWIDPGIGFGKTFDHNLELLRRLSEISSLGLPVLVGASRKSFLGTILDLGVSERLEGSLAAAEAARLGGASMLRVHDVAETRRFVDTLDAIFGAPADHEAGS